MNPEPRPLSGRLVALLCVIATVALGHSASVVVVPVILLLLLGSFVLFGAPVLTRPRMVYAALLAVPFVLWWKYDLSGRPDRHYVPVDLLYAVGLYMVAVGTHHVLSSRQGGGRDYALACAIMGLGMAGTANVEGSTTVYRVCLALFIPILLWAVREELFTGRWSWKKIPWKRLAVALVLLLLAQAGFQRLTERLSQVGDQALRQVIHSFAQSGPGFDHLSRRIGSISEMWEKGPSQEVALRIFSERPHTYLRGAVFDSYQLGNWSLSAWRDEKRLKPAGRQVGRNVFELAQGESGSALATVYPEPSLGAAFFVPLGTHRVSSYTDQVRVLHEQRIVRPETTNAGGYEYFSVQAPLEGPDLQQDLLVPLGLRAAMEKIAREVADPGDSPQIKMDKLQKYFQSHFAYELGVPGPEVGDPLLHFLFVSRRGHCEYFASAAVMILRTMGVPCRYATGFVCQENGATSNLWIARRRDAHAWVEAWTEPTGWIEFEPTPPSARPPMTASQGWEAWSEWFSAQWSRMMRLIAYGGVTGLLASLWDSVVEGISSLPAWLWAGVIFTGLLWLFRDNFRAIGEWVRRSAQRPDPRVAEFQVQLRKAEAILARHGLRRPLCMPVGDFLGKVRETALPEPVRDSVIGLLENYQARRFARADFSGSENG